MEKDLILTCDAGTTGCKCALISFSGETVSSVRRSYPTNYPQPNWAEQDPDLILNAVYDGVRELLQQVSPQRIACVGLSGTMNGCIRTARRCTRTSSIRIAVRRSRWRKSAR